MSEQRDNAQNVQKSSSEQDHLDANQVAERKSDQSRQPKTQGQGSDFLADEAQADAEEKESSDRAGR